MKVRSRKRKKLITNARKPSSAIRLDPTRTVTLRRTMIALLRRRFSLLRIRIRKLVVDEDAFGLNLTTLNEYDPDQPRDERGRFGATGAAFKAMGAMAEHAEHVVVAYTKDNIASAVSKLPGWAQSAVHGIFSTAVAGTAVAFAAWRVSQALAERVAIERGATPEEARRLRGVLSSIDIAAFKPVALLTATNPIAAGASWIIPPATGMYLAYSTARNPLKTARAAVSMVKDALGTAAYAATFVGVGAVHTVARATGIVNVSNQDAEFVADALEEHNYDDWYIALLSAALDGSASVVQAILIANDLYKKTPTENVFCATGEGGGVDPSCGRDVFEVAAELGRMNGYNADKAAVTAVRDRIGRAKVTPKLEKAVEAVVAALQFKASSHLVDIKDIAESVKAKSDQVLHAVMRGVEAGKYTLHPYTGNMHRLASDRPDLIIPTGSELGRYVTLNTITNVRFAFHTSPDKVKAFQAWLKTQMDMTITPPDGVWQRYADAGYKKGAGRAFDDTKASVRVAQTNDQGAVSDFYNGSKDQFLRSAFGRPVAIEKIKLLAGRSFDELNNVTADMSNRISRSLTDGLVQGQSPREIAREMVQDVDISQERALTIARTEIIRAHAEGQLDALEQLGVTELGVEVEFSATCKDGTCGVCPECQDWDGEVIPIEEAHGIIPVHPGCRCAFIPYVDKAVKDA